MVKVKVNFINIVSILNIIVVLNILAEKIFEILFSIEININREILSENVVKV